MSDSNPYLDGQLKFAAYHVELFKNSAGRAGGSCFASELGRPRPDCHDAETENLPALARVSWAVCYLFLKTRYLLTRRATAVAELPDGPPRSMPRQPVAPVKFTGH